MVEAVTRTNSGISESIDLCGRLLIFYDEISSWISAQKMTSEAPGGNTGICVSTIAILQPIGSIVGTPFTAPTVRLRLNISLALI